MMMAQVLASRSKVTSCIGNVRTYAAATATASTPPLMWRLAHGIFDPDTSMSEKFPGIPEPDAIAPPTRSAVEVTTLSNGVRVASQDLGGPVSAVGLFISAGSRYETPHNQGVSHLIDHLAYKGTTMRSKFRITRDMEKTGATFNSSLTRDTISLFAESLRESLADVVDIIAESATKSAAAVADPEKDPIGYDIAMAEIKTQTDLMRSQLAEFNKDPSAVVMEAVHNTAFEGNTVGLPMLAEERKLNQLTPQTVADFVSRFYTPDRIVLSGANVGHKEFTSMAEKAFGSMEGKSKEVELEPRYTGGSKKLTGDGGAHIAIGYNGVSWKSEDLVPVCVLGALLGGGGSFSSGGPGKGLYTRLYTEVLNRYGWVSSATVFNQCFKDGGLFGIQASTMDSGRLNNLIEIVSTQVAKLADTPTNEELTRAKAMQKSSLALGLESRVVVCEDIGRQIVDSGKFRGPEELMKAIDAVTAEDVRRAALRMLATKPTVVMYGDSYDTYSYEMISSSINSQARLTG